MTTIRTLMAASLLAATSATIASAGNLALPTEPKIKVTKAQLAIKSPNVNVCPAAGEMSGWIFTTKPGTIHYMIARKGGDVSGPFEATAVKGANGLSMASFTNALNIEHKIDAEYRIIVGEKYGLTLSNWAPLKASCLVLLGG